MKKRLGRRGDILIGNVVFILINILFLVLLILFLLRQGNGVIVLEQMYAKEIALSIDYAKPVMLMKLDMEKGMKLAKKNGIDFDEAVKISGNVVMVKLSDNSGYTYSFFNNVEAEAYPSRDSTSHYDGLYIITVGEKTMHSKDYFFNKKGADKVLSMYWFVVIIIVAVGIFAMIYMFYSYPYDVRDVESEILSSKIADCISRNGEIDPYFLSKEEKNVFTKCSLNFNVENEFSNENPEQYFFDIEIFPLEDSNSKISLSGGNINWKSDCFIEDKKGKEYKKLVKCSEKRIYAVDSSSKQYLIKILSGVGKSQKNVKL